MWQIIPGRPLGPLDPGVSLGGFVASPVTALLRCDVTAHALLAMGRDGFSVFD
jgi:hypothetical protein